MEVLKMVKKLKDEHNRIVGCIAIRADGTECRIPKHEFLNYEFSNVKITSDLKIKAKNTNNTLTLYHGSRMGIKGQIKATCSRELCDFGKGFYTGDNIDQAKTIIINDPTGIIYTLKVSLSNLKTYIFDDDTKWALYVGASRGRIDASKYKKLHKFVNYVNSHDLIIGPIADDRMMFIYSEFIDGNITDKALIECLKYVKLGNQYVFKTDKACRNISITSTSKLDATEIKRLRHAKNIIIGNIGDQVEKIKYKFRRQGNYIEELLETWR